MSSPASRSGTPDDWRYLAVLGAGMLSMMFLARTFGINTGNVFVAFLVVGFGTFVGVGLWHGGQALANRARTRG